MANPNDLPGGTHRAHGYGGHGLGQDASEPANIKAEGKVSL